MSQNTFSPPTDGLMCSKQLFEAITNENSSTIDRLITNDFTVGFQGRTLDGLTLKQAVSKGELIIESGILSGATTRDYDNCSIVTGQWDVSLKLRDRTMNVRLVYMTVCVRIAGMWKVATIQLTATS